MFFQNFGFDGIPGGGMPGGGMPHRSREPVDTEKLYKLLEVNKDATENEIKKAYRKMAIKHHPDKGGDPEKFKEISKAYEILSDPEKRRVYDEHGEEGLEGNYTASDATDLFDLLFGGGGRRPKGKKRGEDVVSQLKVTLEQIYNGAMKKLAINKDIICDKCEGHGGPKDAFISCSYCNGQGVRVQIRQMGAMIHQTQSVCSQCAGQGRQMADEKRCKSCYGKGVKQTKKILEVFVDRGVPDQHKVTFYGEADERPNETPGNVIFVVCQQPHETFKRNGNDLFITKSIPLYEALTGCNFYIKHLDNRVLQITTQDNEVVVPGSIRVIQNEGMPIYKSAFSKGNLYITFDVVFPVGRTMSPEEKQKLLELFPYKPEEPIKTTEGTIEQVTATEVDPEEIHARSAKQSYEQDDDHEPGRVQCKQQ
ncbi:bifunctional Heat shock protein DnaJ [Babesia duncani]|uniref:Bifunctional Heat shock protein DnaJ n=1 Tax=Babesia duncani TaxID=323732 RepID=A0AAD9UNB7_9APIC|nr:bifunctional Heat shock protein DnaJ [Babesia duncani]